MMKRLMPKLKTHIAIPMRHKFLFIVTLVALTTAALIVTSAVVRAADDKAAAGKSGKPALTVTSIQPQSASLSASFGASGNIAAWQEAIVGAEINGLRINDVRANTGDVVKKGQVLATFATETVEAELAQSKANVAEAEAALAEAQANADRAKLLDATGAMSAQQIQQFTTAAKTADARLLAAKALAKVQQVRLTQTRLLAPDDGTISARLATVGAVVQAGQELFRMVRRDRLEWRAEVTASELSNVSVGQKVRVITPTGDVVAGTVRMVAPTVDPMTRNVQVFVDLAGSRAAKAGMFARGEFQLAEASGLTLPQQAVVVRDGFSYVFAIGKDERVKQIKVVTGRRVADRIEIKSGVTADSTLVSTGAGFLKDGDLVRLVPAVAAVAPAPASAKK